MDPIYMYVRALFKKKGQKVGFSMHINSVMMGEMIMGKPFVI